MHELQCSIAWLSRGVGVGGGGGGGERALGRGEMCS